MDYIEKVKISDFNVHIGNQQILKNINAVIPEKKITVIIGPSGCGKTTLLKSLNRLVELHDKVKISGNVFIDNCDIYSPLTDVTELRRRMGLLSQRPYPLPMNILKNVAYGLKISGRMNRRILKKRVEYYLRQASLWDEVKDRLREPASHLSIGQQQRLCLARGLAVDPDFILADEPTSALDPISGEAIEKKFIELKDRYTVVMVTHILRQARRIADYVIFMYLGEIIEQGPAKQIFENPEMEKTKLYIKGMFN